ncbi:MAG: hypothetical protein J6Z12_07280 [Paludibacteraceae bacterium]|nr:hypothetical protein [Paludibacteraceae bacterium]
MNRLNSYIERYKLVFSLLLSNVLLGSLMLFSSWHYEATDDYVMARIASGAYSGTPDAHLVFIHYLYGQVVAVLYRLLPSIEWYTWLFVGFHFVSLTTLTVMLFDIKHLKLRYLAIFALCALEVRIFYFIQFTTVAAVLATTGLLLVFRNRSGWQLLGGCVCFLLAVTIRFHAAMLVGAIAALFYPLYTLKNGFSIRQAGALAVCVALAFALRVYNRQVYRQDAAWNHYYQYNTLRGQINDNPYSRRLYRHLPEGVSVFDYYLLCKFFPDWEVLTLEDLQTIQQSLRQDRHMHGINRVMKRMWKEYHMIIWLLLCLFVATFFRYHPRQWLLWLPILGLVGLTVYVDMHSVFKDRVFITMYMPALMFLTLLEKERMGRISSTILLLTGGCWLGLTVRETALDNNSHLAEYRSVQEKIPMSAVYSNLSIATGSEYTPPLQLTSHKGAHYVGRGWLSAIPFDEAYASFRTYLQDNAYLITYNAESEEHPSPFPPCVTALVRSLELNDSIYCKPVLLEKTDHFILLQLHEK